MSRRDFRVDVVHARPPSAWVMAGVAGVTLWITGQLAMWATALQALALVTSLVRRKSPWPWMKNPVQLNLLMFAVVGATIQVAFQSASSVIALAHFAALAQGVQLLDARPRRSEFLLVALALFQVVLAANLTDSLLFLPLLSLFLFSTTWTLIVHTLRIEAAESGDVDAARSAITPGLLRTTLVAAALTMALAAVLFVLLPRMRSSIVNANVGGSSAVAGFSDKVELGTIGQIRKDTRVVLRVETLEGDAPPLESGYWRGLAFDSFDGWNWQITPNTRHPRAGSPKLGIDLGAPASGPTLVQRIVREPVQAGVLFTAGLAQRVQGAIHSIETDRNGGVYDPAQFDERVRYTVVTQLRVPSDEDLAATYSAPPRDRDDRYLALPDFDAGIERLAASITRDAANDAQRARAIESHLRTNGVYTDAPPPVDGLGDHTAVESFLLEERPGHCEYFASGMVVLARSVGLHARLVNGFAGGRVNSLGGFTELLRSDAHAWVEVHYDGVGWVRYDPTPPDRRLRAMTALSLGEHLSELRSAIELWWFQRVVDFDSSDQIRALKAIVAAYRGEEKQQGPRTSTTPQRPGLDFVKSLPWRDLALVALAIGLAICAWLSRAGAEARPLDRDYAAALRLLSKQGLARGPATTARDFADEVGDFVPGRGARAFADLTEHYLAARFGGRQAADGAAQLSALRSELERIQSAP